MPDTNISRLPNSLYTIEDHGRNITFIGIVSNIQLENLYNVYNVTRDLLYYNVFTKIDSVILTDNVLRIDNYFIALINTDILAIDVYSDFYTTNGNVTNIEGGDANDIYLNAQIYNCGNAIFN